MKLISLLLCVALIQIVSATVISLEEGDADTKRIFKWILDPVSPSFPLPRFRLQDGSTAETKEFRFLGTLNCSALPTGSVGMAIYDPTIDDWNCTSTGNLPNDTSTPSDTVIGLPLNCTRNFVAVWNHTLTEWSCSSREALLFQSQPLIAENQCRSEDLLTINYDQTDTYRNRPAGLCVAPGTRQVGPDATVQLKRNSGDPDEAFYVQTTSKAIANLGAAGGSEHFKWQYWSWSPLRTSFASPFGSYPPILAFDGMRLAAVSANTYGWTSAGAAYSVSNVAVNFQVVKLSIKFTGNYPSITYMQYIADPYTTTIVSPSIVTYNTTQTVLPGTALAKGNALSIQIMSIPAGLTTTPARNQWFTVSLWVSQITKEA